MTHPANPWQPAEDAVLRKSAAAGHTIAQIVALLPLRSESAVAHRCHKLGLGFHRLLIPWSDTDDAELLRLTDSGLLPSAIEKALRGKRMRNAIIGRLDRLGRRCGGRLARPKRPTGLDASLERKAKLAAKAKRGSAKHPHGKNNNPTGWTGRAGSTRGPDGLPPPLPDVPGKRVSIVDLGPRQCRYIAARPELITLDTAYYCGCATDGGSWCPAHRAGVFGPLRRAA